MNRTDVVLAVLILIFLSASVYLLLHERTEVIYQRRHLAALQSLSDDTIESIYLLRRREGIPETEVTLTKQKDGADIRRIMAAVRHDLWVDRREINPNGNESLPAYDDFRVRYKEGRSLGGAGLNCWFGKEGGSNPSLALRSRNGNFKRVIQDILKRKGIPLICEKPLATLQGLSDDNIESLYLRWRGENPEKHVTLIREEDGADIRRIMAAVRHDLWVDRREINPNGNEPPPGYDDFVVHYKGERSLRGLQLPCWFGKEGGSNPSLALRSRNGTFKRVIQDILNRKGRPLTRKKSM